MAVTLAFYIGQGDWLDRAVRWSTRSAFSHVELVTARDGTERFRGLSASFRDGGVREKWIEAKPDHWSFVPLPWADHHATIAFARQRIGAPYDLLGILGSQVLSLRRHSRSRWFCSELCAAALNLGQPETLSPGGLHARTAEITRAYAMGRGAV